MSQSNFKLQLTLWNKFGRYRRHTEMNFETGKCTFPWKQKSNVLKFFEISTFPLYFTDFHSCRSCSLWWLLSIQIMFSRYLKISPDLAEHTEINLKGTANTTRCISGQENALFYGKKIQNFWNSHNLIQPLKSNILGGPLLA